MIAFLTQYYRGLGHAMRIKYISDCLPKNSFIVINQLYEPPISYNTDYTYYLEDTPSDKEDNNYKYLMHSDNVRKRVSKLKELLDKHSDISVLVCEGFPFCRQQFSYEYFSLFEECKKRNIKIIISIRDYPWDEPHENSLQDWVAKTINHVIINYDCDVMIHGDAKYLPLMSDATRNYYWSELIEDIKGRLLYTGYVCNPTINRHSKKNNYVYISCGLNKEEGLEIYNSILKSVVPNNPELKFIVALGDKTLHNKIGDRSNKQIEIVNYIPNLSKHLEDCFAFITYGGYNSTTDILKSKIPAIIIPRQSGNKVEQLIRCYKLKHLELFKICSYLNLKNIDSLLQEIKKDYENFPNSCDIDLGGAINSARIIQKYI
jgi:predicted glycosyltransferase